MIILYLSNNCENKDQCYGIIDNAICKKKIKKWMIIFIERSRAINIMSNGDRMCYSIIIKFVYFFRKLSITFSISVRYCMT